MPRIGGEYFNGSMISLHQNVPANDFSLVIATMEAVSHFSLLINAYLSYNRIKGAEFLILNFVMCKACNTSRFVE